MKSMDYLSSIVQEISDIPLKDFKMEEQNKEYEGATFVLGNQSFRSRMAKLTPKKQGYFVVFWEKDEANKNKSYDFVSAPDKLIITIVDQDKRGQFVFPKEMLAEKRILRNGEHKGKMALRVYPDWVTGLSKTATRTQRWQSPFFIDLTTTHDLKRLEKLYLD
ncbi:MepB family protein [Enterococcus plantarum]|uniref:MepB family protein n=1 Tax=Enterococcus plantarum TaxID=1077675 RepID=UPI001A8F0BCA|nr:MepB family protein [Enterococcus plantarum]MBO0424292.1 MepB family protein [Enterococcus plantarum]MBO0468744.1 MepB family protein [Enterococcus plantarum]